MLVLSRRESERVRLGDSIVLTIVRVSGDKVRLGIEAPPNVLVLRDELQLHAAEPPASGEPPASAEPLTIVDPLREVVAPTAKAA